MRGIITGGEERVMEPRDWIIGRAIYIVWNSPRILTGLESRGQTGDTVTHSFKTVSLYGLL